MRTKEDIVSNWLPRYTGLPLEAFKKHVLLTNFDNYIDIFCEQTGATVPVEGKSMRVAVAEDMVMINFGMGSPNAATLMDLLSAIKPETVLFLGKCGGLKKKNALGDLVLPIAAIRGEGTSNDYFPPELPALPSFMIHRAVSHVIRDMELDYWSGTVYTTNRRVWEHDDKFKEHLRVLRCHGHRHGNGDAVHDRLRERDPHRSTAAGERPTHGALGHQDQRERHEGDHQFRGDARACGDRFLARDHQWRDVGEAPAL